VIDVLPIARGPGLEGDATDSELWDPSDIDTPTVESTAVASLADLSCPISWMTELRRSSLTLLRIRLDESLEESFASDVAEASWDVRVVVASEGC
jgi:hypothetical protein